MLLVPQDALVLSKKVLSGHQGVLTLFEKGGLDVLLSRFGCGCVLLLVWREGLGVP